MNLTILSKGDTKFSKNFCNILEFYFSLFNNFIHLTEEYTEELQDARDRLEPWTEIKK